MNTYKKTELDKKVEEKIKRYGKFGLIKTNKKFNFSKKLKVIVASGLSAIILTLVGCGNTKTSKSEPEMSSIGASSSSTTTPEETPTFENEKSDSLKTDFLGNLGKELELPEKETNSGKIEIGEVTGNVQSEKVVEDENGTLWATKEDEEKKDEIGTTVTDTKNDTLEEKDGKVVEKQPSYEIKDENDNVKETGTLDSSSDLPGGWSYDETTGKNLHTEDVGKYVTDDEGNLWLKEDWEAYLEALKKANESGAIVKEETEVVPSDPVVVEEGETVYTDSNSASSDNSTSSDVFEDSSDLIIQPESTDGLYLDQVSGLYFESKADYEQWVLQDYEGYNLVNGVMRAQTKEMDEALKEYVKSR